MSKATGNIIFKTLFKARTNMRSIYVAYLQQIVILKSKCNVIDSEIFCVPFRINIITLRNRNRVKPFALILDLDFKHPISLLELCTPFIDEATNQRHD